MKSRTWIAWASLLPALAVGCGGLLEVDELTFDQDAGAGATAGSTVGGSSGNSMGGSAGSTGGSAGSTGGIGGSAGSTGGTGGTGGTAGGNCQSGSEFNGNASLDCFFKDQPAGTMVSIAGGQLVIDPVVAPWFEEREGFFLYRDIGKDNFIAAVQVTVSAATIPTSFPTAAYAGGGLALRKNGDSANNVLISFSTYGGGSGVAGPYAHWTLDNATLAAQDWTFGAVYAGWLGLCRVGNSVNLYYRTELESSPTLLATVTTGEFAPDVSSLNQLGITAHAFDGAPDTRVKFNWFRIARGVPATLNDCLTQFNTLIAQGD